MKLKSMALVGMGMLGTLAIQKYGVPMMKKAEKAINKKVDQMM